VERSKEQILESPIFVVGPLRSGTTLLRLMLDHHPDINCFGEFEASVSQARADNWPDIESFHTFLESDRQTLAYDFSIDKSLAYEDLIKSLLEQEFDKQPNKHIGASVHSRMDLLPKLWPNAKFVHILRDPRDVARSCIGMGWVGNVFHGAKYWLKPERHWDILCKKIPKQNTLTVRYEDLVREPEKVLSEICSFLRLEFHRSMLNIEGRTSYSQPDAKFAEQWKRKLGSREIAWVESECRELMERRGYTCVSPVDYSVSLSERCWLVLQNRFSRVRFNVDRYGFSNWLFFVLAKRVGPKKLHARYKKRINR